MSHYWAIYLSSACRGCLIEDNQIRRCQEGGTHVNNDLHGRSPAHRLRRIRSNTVGDCAYIRVAAADSNCVSVTHKGVRHCEILQVVDDPGNAFADNVLADVRVSSKGSLDHRMAANGPSPR